MNSVKLEEKMNLIDESTHDYIHDHTDENDRYRKRERLDLILKAYFMNTFATRPSGFCEAFEEQVEAFFDRIEFLSNAYLIHKNDRVALRCAALILAAATVENPKAPEESAHMLVELLFTGETASSLVKEKIFSALHGYFQPETLGETPTYREVFHDAAMAMESRKDVEEQLILRHCMYSHSNREKVSHDEWFQDEVNRLKEIRFRTFAAQIQYGKKLGKNLEQLKEIQSRVTRITTPSNLEKKTMSMYRSVSRNMIDMIALADRKAGLLLSANAISLSVIVSFFARGEMDLHPKLYSSAVLIAATCAMTVFFAALAARPLSRSQDKASLDQMMKSEGGLLHYGNASRLSSEDFVKGVRMTLSDEAVLEQGLIEEMHFFSKRIVQKFAMVRRAYVTMFSGIILTFSMLILSRFIH